MSTRQRIIIGIGCCILVAMMVIGAYSAGYYVGHNRVPTGPLPQAGGPGMPPDQFQQWPQRAPRPDITGVVLSKGEGILVIGTPQGPRNVTVSSDTKVILPGDQEGTIADIRKGTEIGVIGTFEADGRVLVAEVIIVMQRRP